MRLILLLWLLPAGLAFAQPTDNPYRTFYPQAPQDHWTDSIRWNQVWNIQDFQDTTMVARYNKARDFVAQQGGGVLFFPAGTYTFENSIQFASGVVIRGETPIQTLAKDSLFAPPTRFVFPAYIPSDTGLGTPNSTAFKSISSLPNTSNSGMVYVDVNRASVSLRSQTFITVQTSRGSTSRSVETNRNLILFGIRSNNVASPYNTVPSTRQYKWQRFSSPFASNISIYAWKNGCIANCRINDFERNGVHPIPNLSFPQPGYLAERVVSGQTLMDTMQGHQAMFNYTDHHGISVNRKATISNATPEEEPGNFCPGLEVRDNWIYKTMRVGIICSGLGIVLDNNEIHDNPGKQTWLHPQGIRIASNNAATYENRGIDFGGWDVRITRNDIHVFRHKIYEGPYYSVDGEGILTQECCGGTAINGAYIAHNKTHDTYIGLWKVRNVNNVVIDSNDIGEESVIVTANVGGGGNQFGLYTIRDTKIRGNRCASVITDGNRGGRNLLIEGNTGLGTGKIDAPCFASITGNTGFPTIRYTAVKDTSTWGLFATDPCLPDTTRFPEVQLVSPAANDTTVTSGNPIPMEIRWSGGRVDSIYFYENTRRIAGGLPSQNIWNHLAGPCNSGVQTQLWASVRDTARRMETRTRMVRLAIPCITSLKSELQAGPAAQLVLFPNPVSGEVFFSRALDQELELTDVFGRNRIRISKGKTSCSVGRLPSGMYWLRDPVSPGFQVQKLFIRNH
jgi:hypothetical protein